MALVTITVDVTGYEAVVRFAYDPALVALVKAIPGRRYDPTTKSWTIAAQDVDSLIADLTQLGHTHKLNKPPVTPGGDGRRVAELERENADLRRRLMQAQSERAARNASWAEVLLSKLDPDAAGKAYKRLAGVVHPDVGGSAELMRDLNIARDIMLGVHR